MGAWDVEPRENDTALDYENGIFGTEGCDSYGPQDPNEQRYVAWLVTQLKSDFPNLQEYVAQSLKQMEALLDNSEWLETWRNPQSITASIREQIVDLREML